MPLPPPYNPVPLVLYRIDPDFGAVVATSRNRKIETIESLFAFSKVPGSACTEGGMDFGEMPVVISTILLEHVDIPFSTRNINPPAGGIVIQIVRILDSRKCGDHAARVRVEHNESW